MRTGRAWVLVPVVALAAACGTHTSKPAPRPNRVARAQRLVIFNDWYGNGRIDGVYPCAVVRDAIRHLPPSPPVYSTVYEDFRRYEHHVC